MKYLSRVTKTNETETSNWSFILENYHINKNLAASFGEALGNTVQIKYKLDDSYDDDDESYESSYDNKNNQLNLQTLILKNNNMED